MSKVQYITTEGIEAIKVNFAVYKPYFLEESNDKLLATLLQKNWLRQTNIEFNPSGMDLESEPAISDRKNVEFMYESLKNLPPSYASDERFWVGLIATDAWNFVKYRRKEELLSGDNEKIKNSFLFTRGIKRSNFINCLSRLWWAGKLCYDPDSSNHYWAADLICGSAFASNMVLLSSSNVTANKHVFLGLIDCLAKRQESGETIGRYHYVNALRYLNSLGGSFLLDTISREEIVKIVNEGLMIYGTNQPA